MADIKTHLNNIKGALYGKDVRGSIHDGMDAMNKEVENTTGRQVDLESTFDQLVINAGNSNAEIVDARVKNDGTSYSKLGDRLNAVDSQLEHIDANKIYLNVKDFGAVGDGIADDTKPIQNAIDFAYENNFHIKIPKGFYRVANIQLKSNVNIMGYGSDSVLKLLDNAQKMSINGSKADQLGNYPANVLGTTLIHTGDEWYSNTRAYTEDNTEYIVENVCISNLKIDGNKQNNTVGDVGFNASSMGACICINQSKNIRVVNCELLNAPMDGLYIGHTLHGGSDYCIFENLVIHDNVRCGIAQVTGKSNLFNKCLIYDNGAESIDIEANLKDEVNCKHIISNCDLKGRVNVVCKERANQRDIKILNNVVQGGIGLSDASINNNISILNNSFNGNGEESLINLSGFYYNNGDEKILNNNKIIFANNCAKNFGNILPTITQGQHFGLHIKNNTIQAKKTGFSLILPYKIFIENNNIEIIGNDMSYLFDLQFYSSDIVPYQEQVLIKNNYVFGNMVGAICRTLAGNKSPSFTSPEIIFKSNIISCMSDNISIGSIPICLEDNKINTTNSTLELSNYFIIKGNEFKSESSNIILKTNHYCNHSIISDNYFINASLSLPRIKNCNIINNTYINSCIEIVMSFTSSGIGKNVICNNLFKGDGLDFAIKYVDGNGYSESDFIGNDVINNNIVLGGFTKPISIPDTLKEKVIIANNLLH